MNIKKKSLRLEITNKKYRNVLIVSYGIIAAIAMAIMITSVFTWFNSYARQVIFDMAVSQLNNLDNIVQHNFNTYRMQLQNAWQDPTVKISLYTNVNDYASKYRMSRFLSNMVGNNGVADYVGLYKENGGYQYYGWRYPDDEEREVIEKRLLETSDDTESFVLDTGKRRLLCMFVTERPYMAGKVHRGVFYALNLDRMKKQLFSEGLKDQMYWIFDKNGVPIIEEQRLGDSLGEIWGLVANQSEEYQSQEMRINSTTYICNSKINKETGLYIVMLQDDQTRQDQMSEIRQAVYIPAVASFFLVLLLAVFMANIIYDPLDKFFARLQFNPELLLENDDYSRQQTALTSEKILSQINIMSKQYHSDKLLRYLGEAARTDEMPSALKLEDRDEQCIMILCWTDKEDLPEDLAETAYAEFEERIQGCKIKLVADVRNPWFLLLLKEGRRVNLFSDREQLKERIGETLKQIGEIHSVAVYSAVSDLIEEEKNLQPQFRELLVYIKYHLLGRCAVVMDREFVKGRCDSDVPKRLNEDIINEIRKGNEQAACDKIPGVLENLAGYEIQKAMLFLTEFCTQLKQCMYGTEWTNRLQQESYLDYYIKITSLYDKKDLELYLKQLISGTCLENKVFQEKTLRINMLNAVEYIQEHYRDPDISVEQVADRFYLSVSYFSKLFNEYVGMTFPEFISDLRLTYAKELLKGNPEVSIKKVAEICGFGSVSYFSAQFKKKFGVSPSLLRRKREK